MTPTIDPWVSHILEVYEARGRPRFLDRWGLRDGISNKHATKYDGAMTTARHAFRLILLVGLVRRSKSVLSGVITLPLPHYFKDRSRPRLDPSVVILSQDMRIRLHGQVGSA